MTCPTLEDLLVLVRGAMNDASKAEIQAHLSSGCRICAENHRWLTQILAATAKDDSFEFSAETIDWSVAQFKAASAAAPSRMQILARLIFDNLLPPRPVEVRSMAAPAISRQLLYQAGNYDVDLRLEQFEGADSILVLGQIVSAGKKPADLAALTVELRPHGAGLAPEVTKKTETDPRGMFRLHDVPQGEYDIVVRVLEGDLSINAITCRTR